MWCISVRVLLQGLWHWHLYVLYAGCRGGHFCSVKEEIKQKKLANQYQFPQFHQPQKPDHMTQYNPCEERFVFQNKLVEKPYNRRNCEFTIQSILKRNEPYPNIIDNFSQVNYLIRYDIAWLEYKFPYLPANDIITALSKANGNLPLALMILLES